jgi:hypothetical protein
MSLKVEAGVAITLRTTTRETVEYFTRHGVTAEMEELATRLFDMAVACVLRYESAVGQKRETTEVLEHHTPPLHTHFMPLNVKNRGSLNQGRLESFCFLGTRKGGSGASCSSSALM